MQRIFNELVTLFVVLGPFGTLAVFLALTKDLDPAAARRLAVRGVLYAAIVLLLFVVGGQVLLQALGIPLGSFQLAGSIVLFLFGLRMIFGNVQAGAGTPEGGGDMAVYPLAIPTIAGPGSMLTVVMLTDNSRFSFAEQAETAAEIVVILLLTLILLLAARPISRVIGAAGAGIIQRIMGLILASLAVNNAVAALASLSLIAPRG